MPDVETVEETGGKETFVRFLYALAVLERSTLTSDSFHAIIIYSKPVPGKWFLTGGPDFQICRSGGEVASEP